jgi:outer membrane protein TolC
MSITYFRFVVTVAIASLACLASAGTDDLPSSVEAEQITVDRDPVARQSAAGNPAEYLSIEEAVAIALRDNPGLAEIRARADAMAAIPSQVGTLPDPMVAFNAMNLPTDTFAVSQEPMTQRQLGVSQMIPFPGKLALREQAAEYEAAAAADNVDEARLLLTRDVKTLWWRLFNFDQAVAIVLRNQDLLRQFVEIAQTKYRVGQGLQQDVLLAQLELSKLLDLELRLTGARGNDEARLNALLNVSPDQAVVLPRQKAGELPELAGEPDLYALAEQSRPLLASQQHRIQAANSRVELAEKDYYPDFNIGATYGFRSGNNTDGSSRSDFTSLMLSMNVPIFTERKQSKAVAQRKSEWFEQNYRLHDLRNKIRADISAAAADYRRARDQFELFGTGIIPQAQQTVASMLAGYQVNEVDFLNLVNAQITLYNYEISYWQMLSEARQALARIAAAVGGENIYE